MQGPAGHDRRAQMLLSAGSLGWIAGVLCTAGQTFPPVAMGADVGGAISDFEPAVSVVVGRAATGNVLVVSREDSAVTLDGRIRLGRSLGPGRGGLRSYPHNTGNLVLVFVRLRDDHADGRLAAAYSASGRKGAI